MSYYDSKTDRILLRDGTSVLSSFGYARKIIEDNLPEQGTKVFRDRDTKIFEKLNQVEIGVDLEEVNPVPDEHKHTQSDLDTLIDTLCASERFNGTQDELDRIEHELDYFIRTKNIIFLIKCREIIERFKKEKVVWGVGRGSSCASYICYLLEINDINPLEFDIPFSEMSKESE